MLGVRLDSQTEKRLDRFVRERGRAKSEVARAAIVEYLERHDLEAELRRQVRLISAATTEERLREVDALADDLMRDESDYGGTHKEA